MKLQITQLKTYIPEESKKIFFPQGEIGTPRIETKMSLPEMALEVSQKLNLSQQKQKKGVII